MSLFIAVAWGQNPATAAFPSAVATDTTLGVACNSSASGSTLTNSISSSSMSIPVVSGAAFCSPSYITMDGGTVNAEVTKICSISSNTLNVCTSGRGVHGTAVPHNYGTLVFGYIDQNYFNQLAAEIKAIELNIGANYLNRNSTNIFYGGGTANSGIGNTANGAGAMTANTSGYSNAAFGYQSMFANTTGFVNSAFGNQALYSNTTGNGNSAQGSYALYSNTTGGSNSAQGYQAGYTGTGANANVTGSNNTWIGYQSGPGTTSQLNNTFALGSGALAGASNHGVLGNGSLTDVYDGSESALANHHANYYYATGGTNFGSALHTVSTIVVSATGALPSTGCLNGELAIVTGATPGQQLYENSGAGTCVWTQQSGGSGSGAQWFNQLGDFAITWTSSLGTIGANATSAHPMVSRVGYTNYFYTSPITVAPGSGNDTWYIYDSGGVINVGYSGSAPTCSGCTSVSGISAYPANVAMIGRFTVTSGSVVGAVSDRAAISSPPALAAGTNITLNTVGNQTTISSSGGGSGSSCITTAGQGYWFPFGSTENNNINNWPATPHVYQLTAPCGMTIGKIGINVTTASGTACTGGVCGLVFGLYNSSGSLIASTTPLVSGGTPNLNSTGEMLARFSTAQTLSVGTAYYLAMWTDSNALTVESTGNGWSWQAELNLLGNLVGYAGNNASGDGASVALPSSMGTVNPQGAGYGNAPLVVFAR
jgi:hypothetical protein